MFLSEKEREGERGGEGDGEEEREEGKVFRFISSSLLVTTLEARGRDMLIE